MLDRYSRQILFDGIGQEGQSRIRSGQVTIIGSGALGSMQAESLARAGIGTLIVADRDFVEPSNLHRQTMFTEEDARQRIPKAIACMDHLRAINSDVIVQPEVLDVNATNIEELLIGSDVVLDGTDNFATRYVINDACVKHNVAWIYGAAVSSQGVTMTVRPKVTPCLRCMFGELPPAGSAPTCDTAGVIMPVISVIASIQVVEALKLLTGKISALHGSLIEVDVWSNDLRRISVGHPNADCETCALQHYPALSEISDKAAILCGRDAIQVLPSQPTQLDLNDLARRLSAAGPIFVNEYLLRFEAGEYELTIFRDARSIIRGTEDPAVARSLYSRYVGT